MLVFMAAYNVHEAKTNFSKLLDRAMEGEQIMITRNGVPVVELVPARARGLVPGAGKNDPSVNPNPDPDWWKAMTDDEADAFLDGRL